MNRIENACLQDLSGVRELNTLLKILLKNIDVKDFYWNTDSYIKAAIVENRCFVIKNGITIKSAMILEFRDPDKQYPLPSLAIGTLSVCPGFRRNGLGVQLAEHAKAIAQKENQRLYVESFLEFRQLSFYKRLGFTEAPRKAYHGRPYYVLFIDPPKINEPSVFQ